MSMVSFERLCDPSTPKQVKLVKEGLKISMLDEKLNRFDHYPKCFNYANIEPQPPANIQL